MGMTSTHASSTDIALTEQAGEGASSGGISAGGDQADQAAAVDMPEAGVELDLFGEKIVPAKTPRRQRSPKGNGAPQPSTALPPASAEVDPESTRPSPSLPAPRRRCGSQPLWARAFEDPGSMT